MRRRRIGFAAEAGLRGARSACHCRSATPSGLRSGWALGCDAAAAAIADSRACNAASASRQAGERMFASDAMACTAANAAISASQWRRAGRHMAV
jgi:hypothetical protein